MKVKKVIPVIIVLMMVLSAAFVFGACDKGGEAADLVAVRINGRMAEWTDTVYNFTYEGDSSLNVSVPYTNYLEITDLIVSPEAEGKVYSDSEYTQEITDTSKIHTDGDKSLYIRVTKGKTSRDYTVNVKVSGENLPEGDLSAKDYDNRGGHIYIPENAETVTVDGVEYEVLRGEHDGDKLYFNAKTIKYNTNYILANDIYYVEYRGYSTESGLYNFSNTLDGNGYTVTCIQEVPGLFYKIAKTGTVKNLEYARDISGYDGHIIQSMSSDKYGMISLYNEGTIDNVFVTADHTLKYVDTVYNDSEKDGYRLVKASQYVYENNGGTIKNCIHYGALRNALDERYCIEMGVFTTYANSGTLRNCVNMGTLEGRLQNMSSPKGSFILAYSVGQGLSIEGCYNLGNVETPVEWNEYNGFFAVKAGGASIDTTQTRNYVNKK